MSTIPTDLTAASPGVRSTGRSRDRSPRVTRIHPIQGWRSFDLRELWMFRELFLFFAWRDIKVRYKQTVIGAGWAVLQPVLMMCVFTVFLGRLGGFSSDGIPYPVFVFIGLVPWTFFATAISLAGNSVVGSEKLITKIYFPRIIIPIAAIGTALVDAVIASFVMALLLLVTGTSLSSGWACAPIILLVISMSAVGVGTWLAALNVAYRDFRYIIPFLVQLWLFATPSVYLQVSGARSQVTPGRGNAMLDAVCAINPMTGLIDGFRAALLGQPLDSTALATSLVISFLLLMSGCIYFRRVEHQFADIV